MSNLAIITARGGSKRIPNKNIRDFCGKPIIAYSIEAAVKSGVFDEIMVSTDSEKIASVATSFGAKVPFMRSAETSNDYATTTDVIKEVIAEYEKSGKCFEKTCCIYPTAPFVTSEKLQSAMHLLNDESVDTVIPVVSFSYPPQRGMVINKDLLELREPQHINSRSQDLEKIYHDCGQFYCFKTVAFAQNGNLLKGKIKPLIVNELEVQDIDEETDWNIAEIKYRMMLERNVWKN